jgi:hypothetical protein
MTLFVCSQCGCVDLVELVFEGIFPPDAVDQTCTECQTGQWHQQFPKERYCPEQDVVCNRETGLGLG